MRSGNIIKNLLLLACAFTLSGCADEMNRLQLDLRRVEGGLNDMRGFQAEQTTRIADLDAQVRALSGRIDELEFAQKQKLGSLDALKSDLGSLQRRVPPPAVVPGQALEEDELAVEKLPTEIAGSASAGLQALRDGKFDKALAYWQEVLDLSVGTQWAAMAIFWTGVSYEGQSDYKRALESYHDLAQRYPKYSRVPAALLRQAAILGRLGDKKAAKLTLNKIITSFPKSSEAAKARERLKEF